MSSEYETVLKALAEAVANGEPISVVQPIIDMAARLGDDSGRTIVEFGPNGPAISVMPIPIPGSTETVL